MVGNVAYCGGEMAGAGQWLGEMLRQEQGAACDDGDGDRSAGSGEQLATTRTGDGDGTEALGAGSCLRMAMPSGSADAGTR
ncbi:unnamed protein product [Linum trigynum]|uniref:Uncharacterized protein n=1 Tax=Linum trigynum TaxID=586398 RepID=A0AAV2D117_9ROSI